MKFFVICLRHWLMLCFCLIGLLSLAGCGGGGGDSAIAKGQPNGPLVVKEMRQQRLKITPPSSQYQLNEVSSELINDAKDAGAIDTIQGDFIIEQGINGLARGATARLRLDWKQYVTGGCRDGVLNARFQLFNESTGENLGSVFKGDDLITISRDSSYILRVSVDNPNRCQSLTYDFAIAILRD